MNKLEQACIEKKVLFLSRIVSDMHICLGTCERKIEKEDNEQTLLLSKVEYNNLNDKLVNLCDSIELSNSYYACIPYLIDEDKRSKDINVEESEERK